jgi:mRNA interferase RelE/StbE
VALTPVEYSPRFIKSYKKKPGEMQEAIRKAVTQLRTDYRHKSLRARKMRGHPEGVWEARIDDSNRLTFHWKDGTIVLRNHCNHSILGRRP